MELKNHQLARQIAFRDISEYCKEERDSRRDSFGPVNYLPFEAIICQYAGVKNRIDFRRFNGKAITLKNKK